MKNLKTMKIKHLNQNLNKETTEKVIIVYRHDFEIPRIGEKRNTMMQVNSIID